MVKTTPPGAGSQLLTVTEDNPVYAGCLRTVNGARLAVTGPFEEGDLRFLCEQAGDHLLTWIGRSDHARAAERGEVRPLAQLEPPNRDALARMNALVDATPKDWATYQRYAVEFHLRNAAAWVNERTGTDLADQVDPDFVHGPDALPRRGVSPILRP
jgi:CO dehydrogenase maturation factor